MSARRNDREECIHYVCTNCPEPSIRIPHDDSIPAIEPEDRISPVNRPLLEYLCLEWIDGLHPCMRENQQLPSLGRVHRSCHIVTVLLIAYLTRQGRITILCTSCISSAIPTCCWQLGGSFWGCSPIELSEVYGVVLRIRVVLLPSLQRLISM